MFFYILQKKWFLFLRFWANQKKKKESVGRDHVGSSLGDEDIKLENLLSKRMRDQRCEWPDKHDFPYLLYMDGTQAARSIAE